MTDLHKTMYNHLDIKPEIGSALNAGRPVVALESTIITHGMPYPKNLETALQVEQMVRDHGAVPATIALIEGRLKVGLREQELEWLASQGPRVKKASRRDLPMLISRKENGATTVAATMIAANMAGIRVFATGGIGGVHRGAAQSMDISADLQELARTNVAVVCAGAKSILDIGLTLEYLETLGVPVIGYRTEYFPAFFVRNSGLPVDFRAVSVEEIAHVMYAKWNMTLAGGLVVANPIPEAYAMDSETVNQAIELAISEADKLNIRGKDITPFLLARMEALTGGQSLEANVQLVLNNASLAARLASAYAGLTHSSDEG